MPVTKQEAQQLADQGKPIFGWISEGNGWYSAPGPDLYGITITKAVNAKGGTDFIFTRNASPTSNRVPVQ